MACKNCERLAYFQGQGSKYSPGPDGHIVTRGDGRSISVTDDDTAGESTPGIGIPARGGPPRRRQRSPRDSSQRAMVDDGSAPRRLPCAAPFHCRYSPRAGSLWLAGSRHFSVVSSADGILGTRLQMDPQPSVRRFQFDFGGGASNAVAPVRSSEARISWMTGSPSKSRGLVKTNTRFSEKRSCRSTSGSASRTAGLWRPRLASAWKARGPTM